MENYDSLTESRMPWGLLVVAEAVLEYNCIVKTAQMRIYEAMVAINGVRSYIHVRADNMSQVFDCALTRASAKNPRSYVEVSYSPGAT